MDALAPAVLLLGYWYFYLRHRLYFEGLCFGLKGSLRKRSLTQLVYEGEFQRRPFKITYSHQLRRKIVGIRHSVFDKLEFQIPIIQKFWLRLLPQRAETEQPDEIVIDNPAVDQRFVIHTNQPDAAREYLNGDFVQLSLRMLPITPDRIEFHRGKLIVHITDLSKRALHPIEIRGTIDSMIRMVTLYEQQVTRTFRIAAALTAAICPFCRCGMDQNTERLVRCNSCSTTLHDSCWNENGQCTTWGCHSTQFV